ncbi:TetR/AcrR family transcriptional regulator [Dethiothermospora halolimnae]|uniref:TetR/AcrR family transcriptional regulator n=1 Tax=Dethiothermospora halolimnae TaxID=3114390 RepID=UPI003CCB86ED
MINKEERREKILDSALDVFSQNGYYKSKIEDIAKEAGIGKGTVYEYFESKKNLFQELVIYTLDRYFEDIYKIIEQEGLRNRLLAYAFYHGESINRHMDMMESLPKKNDIFSSKIKLYIKEFRQKVFILLEDILKEAINRGEVREDLDINIASFMILGTINQYYAEEIFLNDKNVYDVDHKKIVDFLVESML